MTENAAAGPDSQRLDLLNQEGARVSVSLVPTIAVVGADADQRERLDEALARFRNNGLELPDLEVRFFGDLADCRGHLGLFQRSFTPWRILICSDMAFVPSHELAHAWEAATLSDQDRTRYLQARGLSHWDAPDVRWSSRGQEDAAFIVQRNLTGTKQPLTSPIWQDRIAAYELLTGRQSPLRADDEQILRDAARGAPGVEFRTDAEGNGRGPDHIASYVGGTAARLRRSDGTLVPGELYLLMATPGSDAHARLYEQTPFTHDQGPHADTIVSNAAAQETAVAITNIDTDLVEFTTAPGGGPSGGLTYLLAYLNIISDGEFTADFSVATTGELEAEGYIDLVTAVNEKVGAARAAGVDVLFTSTAPSHAKVAEHAERHVGQWFHSRHGRVTLAEERQLGEYQTWGATRPAELDIVVVGHIADVAAYLCGARSQFACLVADRLGGTTTSDTLTSYDLIRLAIDDQPTGIPLGHPSLGSLQ